MAPTPGQQAFIDALVELYCVILHMANIPSSAIVQAPEQGHELPRDLVEVLRAQKAPEVEQLLRIMPKLQYETLGELQAAPETFFNFWHTGRVRDGYKALTHPVRWAAIDEHDETADVEPHEVALTSRQYRDGGDLIIVDARSVECLVKVFNTSLIDSPCATHRSSPDVCPPLCVNKGEWISGVDCVQQLKEKFLRAEYMINMDGRSVTALAFDNDWVEELHAKYLEYGWPDQYRAEDCRRVIESDDFPNFSPDWSGGSSFEFSGGADPPDD